MSTDKCPRSLLSSGVRRIIGNGPIAVTARGGVWSWKSFFFLFFGPWGLFPPDVITQTASCFTQRRNMDWVLQNLRYY